MNQEVIYRIGKQVHLVSAILLMYGITWVNAQSNIHSPGEGGVFTQERLALLKSDRGELGGLGNNPSMINLYNDMRGKFAKMGEEVKLSLEDIDGTIYLNKDFKVGTIYDEGVAFRRLHMRYDAYNDELELKESNTPEEHIKALVKHKSISCTLNGNKWQFLEYLTSNNEKREGYLIVIHSGDSYSLYKRKMKIFKEGKPAKTSLGTSFPHRFVDDHEYYIALGGSAPVFLKPKKSEVIKAFGEERSIAIKKYIKDKKINVNDQKDLLNLFVFSNSL